MEIYIPNKKNRNSGIWSCSIYPILFGFLLVFSCLPQKGPLNIVKKPNNKSNFHHSVAPYHGAPTPLIKSNLGGSRFLLADTCDLDGKECYSDMSKNENLFLYGLPNGRYKIALKICEAKNISEFSCSQTKEISFVQNKNYSKELKILDEKFKIQLFETSKKSFRLLEEFKGIYATCKNMIDADELKSDFSYHMDQLSKYSQIDMYLDLKNSILPMTYASVTERKAGFSMFSGKSVSKGVSASFSPSTPYKVTLYNYIDKKGSESKWNVKDVLAPIVGVKKVKGHSAVGIRNQKGDLVKYTSWPEKDNYFFEQAAAKKAEGQIDEYSFYISEDRYVQYSTWLKKQNFWYNGDSTLQMTWDEMKLVVNKLVLTMQDLKYEAGAKEFKALKKDLLTSLNRRGEEYLSYKKLQEALPNYSRIEGIEDEVNKLLGQYYTLNAKFQKLKKPLSSEEMGILKKTWDRSLYNMAVNLHLPEVASLGNSFKKGDVDATLVSKLEKWFIINDRYNESTKYPLIWDHSPAGKRLNLLLENRVSLLDRAETLSPGLSRQQLIDFTTNPAQFTASNELIAKAAKEFVYKGKSTEITAENYVKRFQKDFHEWAQDYTKTAREINQIEVNKTKFTAAYSEYRQADVRLNENLNTYGKGFNALGRNGLSCADVATACIRAASGDSNFYPRHLLPRDPNTVIQKLWEKFNKDNIRRHDPIIVASKLSFIGAISYLIYLHASQSVDYKNPFALSNSVNNSCKESFYYKSLEFNSILEELANIAAERSLLHVTYLDRTLLSSGQ